MLQFINKKLHVTLADGRELLGTLLAFDKHMNVVLSDVTETRPLSKKADAATVTRTLGLILLRGQHIISIRVEAKSELNLANAPKGKGVVSAAN